LNIHSDGSTQVVHTIIDAHENAITACDISHPASNHEDLLCTAGKDAIVKIWKMTTRECLYLLRGHYDAVVSCMFDSSGNFVVSSGQDAQAIMWRVIPSSKLFFFLPDAWHT
jgi:WD40 repeat protein